METEIIGQLAFGNTDSIAERDNPKFPRRILDMWRLYGKNPNVHCKTCQHFLRILYHNRTYFKCEKSKLSHGAGTDWRAGWAACGLHETGEQKILEYED